MEKEIQTSWAWLKPRLEAAGRTGCEFKGIVPHDCWGEIWPCHSRKRRVWEGDDIFAIALGCQQIAGYLDEKLSHAEMERAVLAAISRAGGLILPEVKAA
jgi:hypothetical protein